eukprot:CAMPEP_0115035884 /NCGR_PEP_ID=MMETSP0216-20121206/41763_1 /TAXON_ID=223996 /ORGANISM="Protocruzia adherens, Strain Boccale" /LENGTH=379 /DNA_ID=CAMNT_0002415547 /DNA_START=75 /DNA_END=1210 /DNA_ORIENTATION=+
MSPLDKLPISLRRVIVKFFVSHDQRTLFPLLEQQLIPILLPRKILPLGAETEFWFDYGVFENHKDKVLEIAYLITLFQFCGYEISSKKAKNKKDLTGFFGLALDDTTECVVLLLIAFLGLRINNKIISAYETSDSKVHAAPFSGILSQSNCQNYVQAWGRHSIEDAILDLRDDPGVDDPIPETYLESRNGILVTDPRHSIQLPRQFTNSFIDKCLEKKMEDIQSVRYSYLGSENQKSIDRSSIALASSFLRGYSCGRNKEDGRNGKSELPTFKVEGKLVVETYRWWETLYGDSDDENGDGSDEEVADYSVTAATQIFDYSKFKYKMSTIKEGDEYQFTIQGISPPQRHHATVATGGTSLKNHFLVIQEAEGISTMTIKV